MRCLFPAVLNTIIARGTGSSRRSRGDDDNDMLSTLLNRRWFQLVIHTTGGLAFRDASLFMVLLSCSSTVYFKRGRGAESERILTFLEHQLPSGWTEMGRFSLCTLPYYIDNVSILLYLSDKLRGGALTLLQYLLNLKTGFGGGRGTPGRCRAERNSCLGRRRCGVGVVWKPGGGKGKGCACSGELRG